MDPAGPLVSLLNGSLNKSQWIAENLAPIILPPILMVFKSFKAGCSVSLDEIGKYFYIYYNKQNFDGHKQNPGRYCSMLPSRTAETKDCS